MKLPQKLFADHYVGLQPPAGQPHQRVVDVGCLNLVERGAGRDRKQEPLDLVRIEGGLTVLARFS